MSFLNILVSYSGNGYLYVAVGFRFTLFIVQVTIEMLFCKTNARLSICVILLVHD